MADCLCGRKKRYFVAICHVTPVAMCHSQTAGNAGSLGTRSCDSPITLLNSVFSAISSHIDQAMDKPLFCAWTGDNARHDTDPTVPQTPAEILVEQRMVASLMLRTFSQRGVIVIPSIGNNDVWPHNYVCVFFFNFLYLCYFILFYFII